MQWAHPRVTDAVIATAYRLVRRRWVNDEETVRRLLDESGRARVVLEDAIKLAPYPVLATPRSTKESRAKATELLRQALAIVKAEEVADAED